MKKEELQQELLKLELEEEAEADNKRKEENFKKFQERPSDWMIGKAHADLNFISPRYHSERQLPLLPHTVSISGNMGTSFQGMAPVTSSTQIYFRNVWNTDYKRNESDFQEKLNKLVQEEVEKICKQLPVVLDMMGLQSLHYWVTEKHFPKDKIPEVKKSIEDSQAEILDHYTDDDFIGLLRNHKGWEGEDDNSVPAYKDVDLSHSRMILYRYIFKHRPTLQETFRGTKFYETWHERIEAYID